MSSSEKRAARFRWRVIGDGLRTRLWPIPTLAVLGAVGLGIGVPALGARFVGKLPESVTIYLFGGGADAARSVLAAIAGSLITVTSLTFSLTVVTLQLASSQYSPRLLRTFTRDPIVQITLALLLATFTFALTVLRTVRTTQDDTLGFVPQLSVTLAYLLALISIVAVAVFLGHLARQIRVESILRDVHGQADATLHRMFSEAPANGRQSGLPTPPTGTPAIICAGKSGFLTSVNSRRLLDAAVDANALVYLDRLPGEAVVAGTPIARAWPANGRPFDDETRVRLTKRVVKAVHTGFERTSTQDVAFGLRQLVDVAVKALSPGINDPTTAVHAIGHAAALLCSAARLDLGPQLLRDSSNQVRAVLPHPDLPALLDLVVNQPRRYGAAEPQVLARLITLLRELAWTTRDRNQQAVITSHLARLRATIDAQQFDDSERAYLAELTHLVELAAGKKWPLHGAESSGPRA